MRDKLIDALNSALKEQFDFVPLDATIKIADQLIAEGFGFVEAREVDVPCKIGDSVFVPYYNEETGVTEIDELQVTEVSEKRIWVCGDDGFDYSADDIGRSVFLSREDAVSYVKSPEYLAERINMVLHFNISFEAKKELLVAGFVAGQEFFEKDTERYIRLTAKGPFDVWKFDVFDKNKELAYETTEFAGRLAIDILSGYVVPATMVQEKSVSELISDAAQRSEAPQGERIKDKGERDCVIE